ncbi:secreted RxLR effector protein 161-like [Phragmites australis]|uniref:secreted RxLR effector protein 161-like n=1 Tax=Phragmites australis TaxID=29695 RepID=UPI002D76BDF0|nr:secreted RxLR effector protein 161-like [Phragmites australis]
MEEWLKLSRESTTAEVDATEYRKLVGSLRYLIHTQPDLAFSVRFVSHFMEWPTQEHMTAVKRILRYVARTINYGCRYRKAEEGQLVGYSNSDLAGDIDTQKSTYGALFFYDDNLGKPNDTVKLNVDNQSALALSKNPVLHERSKHIDVHYHFIRECLDNRSVSADFIGTNDQLADLLKKALGRV